MLEKLKKESRKQLKNYDKPTPPFWHKVGDAIVIAGSAGSAILALNGSPKSTAISLAITAILKIFTNFKK